MIGSFGSSEFGSNEFLLAYSMAHGVGTIKEAIAGEWYLYQNAQMGQGKFH